MTRVDVEPNEDIVSILNKLQNIDDVGIDLYIPVGARIFNNILNLKLLSKEMERKGHVLHFVTDDEAGNTLISMMNSDTSANFMPEDFGSLSMSSANGVVSKIGAFFEKIFSKPRFPSLGIKLPLVILIILALVSFGLYKLASTSRAEIDIMVKSQAFTRSVSINVREGVESDEENGVLTGKTLSTTLIEQGDIDTTGEKLIGKKAEGTVMLFNKTSEEIELDDGTELTYDDDDLVFVLSDDVTIPPIYEKDPTDPSSVLVPGQAEVDIEASDIGEKYNIDGDETLEVEDYKKSELVAETQDDLDGGESELIKIVAEEDLTVLSTEVLNVINEKAEGAIEKVLSDSQKLIEGSLDVVVQSETYDFALEEETEKLSLVTEAVVLGLVYSEEDLKDLLDKLVVSSIPEEYVITDEDREVKVDVLGNTDSSVLSSSVADLQVTSKTFVVPNISREELKEKLKGRSTQEAEEIIGSLKDVDSYGVSIKGGIPFFRKIPKDLDRITLEVTKSDE